MVEYLNGHNFVKEEKNKICELLRSSIKKIALGTEANSMENKKN